MQSFYDSTRSASNSSLVLASGMFSSGWCCSPGILIGLIFCLLMIYFTFVTQIMFADHIDVCAIHCCAALSINCIIIYWQLSLCNNL